MKKRSYLLAALLFVTASIVAFSTPVAKADAHSGTCTYRLGCLPDPGDGGGPWTIYCGNPVAWPFEDNRCYAHWGVAEHPFPPCD